MSGRDRTARTLSGSLNPSRATSCAFEPRPGHHQRGESPDHDAFALVPRPRGSTASSAPVMRSSTFGFGADGACDLLSRDFTETEWNLYVPGVVPIRPVCGRGDLTSTMSAKQRA